MTNKNKLWIVFALFLGVSAVGSEASDPEILKPRVPPNQIEKVRTWVNPLPSTKENIEKGKTLFHTKAFCVTCHGKDGRGYSDVPGLVGKLPRNFTDTEWQAARVDGELMWILKNGSAGTAMAPFIPRVLTEEEAWHIILYVRSFGK
ncbi:MAG: c-type cytochrome [Nitrospinales bacterium]